uniref:Vespid chemotactic peptide L n=1 Tax=Vespula lewisii TaxID=7452 RepID=CRBL_VESLE|nr:RecName: Full=Vespid chemotactic peptide L; Short=VESCP-L; Short=Ves-CP-L [Vespula lewisii]
FLPIIAKLVSGLL